MRSRPFILIIDDTASNINLLSVMLRADYDIEGAQSGATAFEMIAQHGAPDLVLLDVHMPGMDGYEVCRRLKADAKTKNIPIIFLTAVNSPIDEELGLRLGAMDFITKPFKTAILRARVQNLINLKSKIDLLESLVMLDGLTGIANRRRFDEAFKAEWGRSVRGAHRIALIMADIDHFKLYNDHYGHGSGDSCLKKVATKLAGLANRPSDLVARYGGEEFVMLLPETDSDGANLIAERCRSGVESLHLAHGHSEVSPWVTISVGFFSILPDKHISASMVLKRADEMLFSAKKTGRNLTFGGEI